MSSESPDNQIPAPDEPMTGEHPDTHLERDDERWSARNQLRDWGILIVMILIYLAWTGIIYLLEPGIR